MKVNKINDDRLLWVETARLDGNTRMKTCKEKDQWLHALKLENSRADGNTHGNADGNTRIEADKEKDQW